MSDGRTARRDRNRDAAIDAVIELFREGRDRVKPEEVAARSGVSLRSVYRYFADVDELRQAAVERSLQRVAPLLALEGLGEGPLEERIDRFVDARVALHEAAGPGVRAARSVVGERPEFGERLAAASAVLREQAARHFAAELAARPAVEPALDALTQFDGIEHLRTGRGLDGPATAAALAAALRRLLG